MMKKPFVVFMLVVGFLVSGTIWFLQSPQFASILKTIAYRYLPKNMGIEADFAELSIRLFPPGLSVEKPKIHIGERNIVHLPAGSSVTAERIEFNFRLFQVFSGDIRVHQLVIVNGDVHLVLDAPSSASTQPLKKTTSSKTPGLGFHWDELLQVRADSVGLHNVSLDVVMSGTKERYRGFAKDVQLSQWEGKGGLGYRASLDLKEVSGLASFGVRSIDAIQGEAYLNALGLNIESLFVTWAGGGGTPGVEASVGGTVKGNALDIKTLIADLDVQIKGDLTRTLGLIPFIESPKDLPSGVVSLTAKVRGDLLKARDSVQVEGQFLGRNMVFQKWGADLVRADAKWVASPTGGEIFLSKAVVSSQEKPRLGGSQPGWGGKVEVGPARWEIGSASPISVPIHLERAHVHWLAASALTSIYGLDLRATGTLNAKISPPVHQQRFGIQADVDLGIDGFQLDNQKYLKTKPISALFSIPKMRLNGPVTITPTELRPNNLVISMGDTKLSTSGKINFKTGYDLYGSGPIFLEELGKLAGQEIRGQGPLAVHVHGPTSAVIIDIDADFKDAYYLNLALGGVKGRIVWDDEFDHLYFNEVQLAKNSSRIALNGQLDLSTAGKSPTADTADLTAVVSQGNVQDLFSIFEHMTKSFDWFPNDLTGPVKGTMRITGGISLSKLKIAAHLDGTNWERWDERFKTVSLDGLFDGGRYAITQFSALKRSGRVRGDVSYDLDKTLSWNLKTDGFVLSDLDHIARLDVPLRGNLKVSSSGKGQEGNIESTTEMSLTDATVRGNGIPSSRLSWKGSKGVSHVQAMVMNGQGVVDMTYDSNPKTLSTFHAELKQLDFSPVLLLLNPKSVQDKALAGTVSGRADFSFYANQFDQANGSFTVSDYLLSRSDVAVSLDHEVSVNVSNGNFNIKDLILKTALGSISLNLLAQNAVLKGSLQGNLDIAVAEFFTPTIVQVSGTSLVNIDISGKPKEPAFNGTAKFEGGSFRVASLDSPFSNLSGILNLHQNVLDVQTLRAEVGGGPVALNGKISLYSDRYPEINLAATVAGSKIKVYPFQYAQVKGAIGVRGDKIPYLVDGNIFVDSALSKEKVMAKKHGTAGAKSLPYGPSISKTQETNASKFKLNVAIDAPRNIQIKNDLFRDVEAKGNITLVNTLDSPRLLGHAEVVRGKLIFKDHIFEIQNGTAKFDNPNVIDPLFDMNASTEVNGVKIQLFVSGRVSKLSKIELTSNPAMAESDILSLLAVGLTSNDAKRLSSSDHNVVQQGEVTSLLLHSLDFNRDFEDKTGFQVNLDEAVNPQQGVSAFRPQSQSDAAVAPQITIRRKLGERLSLSAGSTVGVGSNKSNQVNLDFLVSPNVSVSGVFQSYGTTSGTADSQQNTQTSTGMDLKFQKRFK